MRTWRVRIGLAAAILSFHDPIRLAEELAIVDILSEGRLDVEDPPWSDRAFPRRGGSF